ncbi:MAG TPA: hypothetical protein VFF73_03705 [Planctomycetota bacterium]|nr:hypothetical protein [Planctomycetota bacterium]
MAGFVPRSRAASALDFLPQKLDQFESFHSANALLKIRELLEHLDRDDVLGHLAAVLRRRVSLSAKAWTDESVKAGSPRPLPEDRIACLALRLDLLRHVRAEKLDLQYFAASFYPGAHLNEKLMHLKQAMVHPLARDLRAIARRSRERLGEEDRLDAEALFDSVIDDLGPELFGSRPWRDSDEVTLEGALDALSKAIEKADLAADLKHDLAIEVKIVAMEAKKAKKERTAKRLDALAAHAPLREAAEAVRKLL